MAIVESRVNAWDSLVGRYPGQSGGPADHQALRGDADPATACPRLRSGIEIAEHHTARDNPYVMLRSPEHDRPRYLRLTPQEWRLAEAMDGHHTIDELVHEFHTISGRLAPDEVARTVIDLYVNSLLDVSPEDALALAVLAGRARGPRQRRRTDGLVNVLGALVGRRIPLAQVSNLTEAVHFLGGRLLFTRLATVLLVGISLCGPVLFARSWTRGTLSLFLVADSYLGGALLLGALAMVVSVVHEAGHALAAQHAGRSPGVAGLVLWFGFPSVFVDTSDLWMASRRDRMRATAAGPVAVLVLAGVVQLAALGLPALTGVGFKLAFLCYVNTLIAMSPLLAFDGHQLLTDWLEIPRLRGRSVAWLRRQRTADDDEGRLVAGYGLLAVAWTAVAVLAAVRIWDDRVSGLITGLAQQGVARFVLLLVILAGLAAPLISVVVRALVLAVVHRTEQAARSLLVRFSARHVPRDSLIDPRARAALASSPLCALPDSALARLAAWSRWVRPAPGTQLVTAGTEQNEVLLVVDGVLEGRASGDPVGTIRERVRAGGLIGLASAVTSRPAPLNWYAVTRSVLLALPAKTIAATVGPLPGPNLLERASVEGLLAEVDALAGRSEDDLLGLIAQARPVLLEQGENLVVTGQDTALVVECGTLSLPGGHQATRGTLLGPARGSGDHVLGVALNRSRLWAIPGIAEVPLEPANLRGPAGMPPRLGSHPQDEYPPLADPPRVPSTAPSTRQNRWFTRRLGWLSATALVCCGLVGLSFAFPAPVYAEAPRDMVVITANSGTTTIISDGESRTLSPGDSAYIGASDTATTLSTATATVTFHGGATAVLCSGTAIEFDKTTDLALRRGLLLVDTNSDDPAYAPLELEVTTPSQETFANRGVARYAVTASDIAVVEGSVTEESVLVWPTSDTLSCTTGTALFQAAPEESAGGGSSRDEVTALDVTPSPSPLTSSEVSANASGSLQEMGHPSASRPQQTASARDSGPSLSWSTVPVGPLAQIKDGSPCKDLVTTATAAVTATATSGRSIVSVTVSWSEFATGSAAMTLVEGDIYQSSVGPVQATGEGTSAGWLSVVVMAKDSAGQTATLTTSIAVDACPVVSN